MPRPTPDLVRRIKETIRTTADADYFFDNLKSPDWIEPLREAEMFKRPPGPVRDGDYVWFPPWPPSRYLARMATKDPEAVSAVIKSMPRTDNARVLDDLADAALAMPPEVAVRLLDRVSAWLEVPNHLLLPGKVAGLVKKLGSAGSASAGLKLASQLFALTPDPRTRGPLGVSGPGLLPHAQSRLRTYEYGRMLGQVLPVLTAGAALETLEWLVGLTSTAIGFSLTSTDQKNRDYSSIWFPALEANAERGRDIKSTLVAGVRDCAESLVKGDRSMLDGVISRLEADMYPVFARIVLYLVRLYVPSSDDRLASRLTDRRLLYGSDFHHEYWLLLEASFAELKASDQAAILTAIEAGPEEYRDSTSNDLTLEDKARYLSAWQVRLLAAIKDHLSPDWGRRYAILIALSGEPVHPSLLSRGSGVWVGPTSPLTVSQLEAMSIGEIVQFLRAWNPPSDNWRAPSVEGLGQALQAAVKLDPARFSNDAMKFQGVAPPYLRALFWGWRQAVAGDLSFSWGDVLALGAAAISQSSQSTVGNSSGDMVALRKSVVDVIGPGLAAGPAEIPFELRPLVWSILEPLAGDSDPSPEMEDRGERSMDPFTLAINSVRGQAVGAVLVYSLWVRRHLGDSGADDGMAKGLDIVPEVRPILEQHVDPAMDGSPAVHSVFGRWFPWLVLIDADWTDANLDKLFPSDVEASRFWTAAWDAYVLFSGIFDQSFQLLESQYGRAIGRTANQGGPNQPRPSDVDTRLAEHLMVMYWRGRIDLAPGGLLDQFFASADDGLRAHAIGFVGRSLLESAHDDDGAPPSEIPAEILDRLMGLWEARAGAMDEIANGSTKELSEFGWWFASGVFEETWATNHLIQSLRRGGNMEAGQLVLERLVVVSQRQPLLAMQALQLLIRSDKEGWHVLPWEGEIEGVLTVAMAGDLPQARDLAIDVIHELGARGCRGYRRLLPKRANDTSPHGDGAGRRVPGKGSGE
jgi:hypothetical protein